MQPAMLSGRGKEAIGRCSAAPQFSGPLFHNDGIILLPGKIIQLVPDEESANRERDLCYSSLHPASGSGKASHSETAMKACSTSLER
jgi:hypothetical protein